MTNYLRKWLFPTLADELAKVLESTPELAKLGLNDEDLDDPYPYLRILDICTAFRNKLLSRGILIVSTDKDCKFEKVLATTKQKGFERCTVLTEFAIKRGKEVLQLGAALGSARDYRQDKALAIAETAAYKAFLKRLSMQYGKEDDPEAARVKPNHFTTTDSNPRILSPEDCTAEWTANLEYIQAMKAKKAEGRPQAVVAAMDQQNSDEVPY